MEDRFGTTFNMKLRKTQQLIASHAGFGVSLEKVWGVVPLLTTAHH